MVAKHVFPMLVLLAWCAGTARAGTDVCANRPVGWDGLIANETWDAAGSPYFVRCSIGVDNLRIERGVEVRIEGQFRIVVLTTITVGVEPAGVAEPVLFTTSNASTTWGGFLFQSTPSGSRFSHCIVERASWGAIYVLDGAPPAIDHSVFRGNSSTTYGGAINLERASGEMTIEGCRFEGNTAAYYGGAMRVNLVPGSHLSIEGSVFQGNIANPIYDLGNWVAGAIWIEVGDTSISRTIFTGNRSNAKCYAGGDCSVVARGGAIFANDDVKLEACYFSGNWAESWNDGGWGAGSGAQDTRGGGIYVNGGNLTASNCIFAGHRTTGRIRSGASRGTFRGAALYVNGGTADLINCTVARNLDTTAIHNGGGTLTILNSIVFFNNSNGTQMGGTINASYSDIQHGWPGVGNLDVNPGFRDFGTEIADFLLSPNSPCIDAGNPDPVYDDACFPPSQKTVHNDMGAFGGPGACLMPPFEDCDGDFVDDSLVIAAYPERDCNRNGILDACEIAADPALDADGDGILDFCGPRTACLEFKSWTDVITYKLVVTSDVDFVGGELQVGIDPTVLKIAAFRRTGIPANYDVVTNPSDPTMPLLTCSGGSPAGMTITWFCDPSKGCVPIPAGRQELFEIDLSVLPSAPSGKSSAVEFVYCLGTSPAAVGNSITDTAFHTLPLFPACEGNVHAVPFQRGDANGDGYHDISDPIIILYHLFHGTPELNCHDAADPNDDGVVSLTDAIYLIAWRFQNGSAPKAYPACTWDDTADSLPNCVYNSCP
jgi:hypothetical protein